MQLINSSSRNVFVLSICSLVLMASLAYCIDFSSDFNIDQNFLNEMKKNFGEDNHDVQQKTIKQDAEVNYPEESLQQPINNDKFTHDIDTEKKSGLEKIDSLQVSNVPQSSINVAVSNISKAELAQKQKEITDVNQQQYNAKKIIDQFKTTQNNTNMSFIVEPIQKISVDQVDQTKNTEQQNTSSSGVNVELKTEKPVTLQQLEHHKSNSSSIEIHDSMILPALPTPVVNQHSDNVDTVITPKDKMLKDRNITINTDKTSIESVDASKINIPKVNVIDKQESKIFNAPSIAITSVPINTKIDTNKSTTNVNNNKDANILASNTNSSGQRSKLSNKTKTKKSVKNNNAILVNNKKNQKFKLPDQEEKKVVKNTKSQTKVQKDLKYISGHKKALLVKNHKKTGNNNQKTNQNSSTLNPISIEEADNLGLKSRSVYDYRNQYLPAGINKKEYSKNNQHIPKAFFHSEYSKLLFTAVLQDNIGAVKELLKKGADINTLHSTSGYTPLMQAVIGRKIGVARYLITRGADFNQQTTDGKTALHFAAIVNDAEMFKMLVAAGINTYITDAEGKKALQYITSSKMAAEVALYYDNMNEALLSCSDLGILGCVKFAIERGANIDTIDKNHNTSLMNAAKNGDEQIVNWLLYKGAKSKKVNIKGYTAAFIARRNGYRELAETIETAAIKEEIAGYNPEEVIVADSNDQLTHPSTDVGMKPIIREHKEINHTKPKNLTIRRYCD